MWHQLNTVVLTCADGRSKCRMVLNSWMPSMSSEHCGALHSSSIAHTRNLSFSSISINITSYVFSSPPLPCSCFSKCDCKSPLQFLQWLLYAWRGSVPRGECLNSSLWTCHEHFMLDNASWCYHFGSTYWESLCIIQGKWTGSEPFHSSSLTATLN